MLNLVHLETWDFAERLSLAVKIFDIQILFVNQQKLQISFELNVIYLYILFL